MSFVLGKQAITLGSGPQCDIHVAGAGVAAEHAQIVRQPDGNLYFVAGNAGPCGANGAPLGPGQSVPFDFRTQFSLGQSPVPLAHPAIAAMLMSRGQAPVAQGQLVFGRDPAQVNVVVANGAVSSRHVTVSLTPPTAMDHGSTSGTWLGQQRLNPNTPTPVDPNGILAIGPIPLSLAAIPTILQQLQGGAPAGAGGAPAGAGGAPAGAGGGGGRRAKHKTVVGQVQMSEGQQKPALSIGRTPDNDIVLAAAQVSSKHAILHIQGGQLFLEDRGSSNGSYVKGQRIAPGQRIPVENGEKVFIGPMPLLIQVDAGGAAQVVVEDVKQDWAGRPLYEIEALQLIRDVPDRDNPSVMKRLLDHVSFKAMPGDLIALMGPSGAGKTTLLLTLNGYMPPSAGQVRINGEDLYAIYDALRGAIGYVPQDDIVHPELTVWEAVRYSAKFRLPADYSEDEINQRVTQTLDDLGLTNVQHLQIGKPEKKTLSGGQRKRVNIAMELVTDPVIMFLDEPTSGLAADDTTALVNLLSELARKYGKTIITTIHQPAKEEYEKFNLTLIMGPGGIPMYYGPTGMDSYRFFGAFNEKLGKVNDIDNPRDMFDMLNRREKPVYEAMKAQDPNISRFAARQAAAREWAAEFFNQGNPVWQKMYTGARAPGQVSAQQGMIAGRPKTRGQFFLLMSRYMKIKLRDVTGTAIMLLQAPIIGVLLAVVFGLQTESVPFWCLGALKELGDKYPGAGGGGGMAEALSTMSTTQDFSGAINFVVVSAVWFGTSNAAREIVSEAAIYRRERMVNLGIFNYVLSKFIVLSMFAVIQCTVLLGIVFFALGLSGGPVAFAIDLGMLVITAMASTALGLLLSAVVTSSEAAGALTPIALIPQVVLGGLMVPMTTNPLLKFPMMVTPARWGFQGMVAQERAAIQVNNKAWTIDIADPKDKSGKHLNSPKKVEEMRAKLHAPDDGLYQGKFRCAVTQVSHQDFSGAWGFANWEAVWLPPAVLGSMMTITLIMVLIALRRRDSV